MSLEGRRRLHDPDAHCADRVRGQKQREWLDEVDDLDAKLVPELVEQDDSLIVPNLDSLILTASGDQA